MPGSAAVVLAAFRARSNRVLQLALMLLPVVFLLLPCLVFAFFFYSHVVSNHAAGNGAENGMMMHEVARHRTDRRAFEAAFGLCRRNAAQGNASGDCHDRDMLHGCVLPTVFWTSGKA